MIERQNRGDGALGREAGGVGRGAQRLHRLEFRGGQHDLEVEAIVGDDEVVPNDFLQGIRNVFGRLEFNNLAALLLRHRRCLDELRERQVPGHGEGGNATELVSCRYRT